jgi:hypothetical protein
MVYLVFIIVERVLAPDERPLEVALTTGGAESPKFVLRLTRERIPSDVSNDTESLGSTISINSALTQSLGQGSSTSTMLASGSVDKRASDVHSPALQRIVLREKNKSKGQKSRHSVSGMLSPGRQNRQSSLWNPFKANRAKSIYETKTAGQLAQEHMKNMTQIGILQVYGVGIAPESHSQYKSVLTNKSETTNQTIKAALERYNLEGRDEKDYLLCDVIGQWDEESRPLVSPLLESSVKSLSPEVPPRTWTTQYSRVLQPEESPLILQTLWKSEEGYQRRFELRKRPPFGRHSTYDTIAPTTDELLESGCYQHPTSTPFLMNLRGYDLTKEFLIYRLIEDVTAVGRDVTNGIGSNYHNITLTGPDIRAVHCLICQKSNESTKPLTDEAMQTWVEPMANAHVALNGGKIDSPNIILPGDLLSIGSHHLFLFKDPSQAKEMMQGLHWEKAPLSQLESRAQSYNSETADNTKPSPGAVRRQRSGTLYADDNSSLASSMADSEMRHRLEKRLVFPYDASDEDALVEQIVLHTDTMSVPCKLAPAYLLAMIVEYSYKAYGLQPTQELVRKLAELIQEVIWEKTRNLSDNAMSKNDSEDHSPLQYLLPNIQPVLLWLSNIVELLHYLCIQLPVLISDQKTPKSPSDSPPSLRQVLGKETQDSMTMFEEVVQFAFQQILYPLTKALYCVLPCIIEGSPFDSEPAAATTTRDIDNVLCVMQAVHDLMSECCLNRAIISQMFVNLFFFINASLVNTLLDDGASQKYYHWTKGVQIRGSLDLFDAWALKNGLRKEFLQYTARLSTVADCLATTKERLLQMSWTVLRNDFPSLHPVQLHRLLSEYQLSSDVERPAHWLPSESEKELAKDRDSLLEKFDCCPPLFMPASHFWLDLEYEPPGEGFQLIMDELRRLCDRPGEEEQRVTSAVQETSILSLEQSQLDDETVIRTGLGIVTPPPVHVAQLNVDMDASVISTPHMSPLQQTLRQDDDKTPLAMNSYGNATEEEGKEVNFADVVEEKPVESINDNDNNKEQEEDKGGSLPDQSVLVPPPRPPLLPPPRPLQCSDEQSTEVSHASMIKSQDNTSGDANDGGDNDDDDDDVLCGHFNLSVEIPYYTQQQKGGTDCGVFAIAFAVLFALGDDVSTVQFDQPRMRQHLVKCFQQEKMIRFPQSTEVTARHPHRRRGTVIELCRSCFMPETFDDTVRCNSCDEWFHVGCLKPSVLAHGSDEWICGNCL